MKHLVRKIIATLMALCMCLVALTACAKQTESTAVQAAGTAAPAETAEETADEAAAVTPEPTQEPTPAPTATPEPAPLTVTIDYHKCPQLIIDMCGEKCLAEAELVIDAFLAGESSVVLPDYEIGDLPKVQFMVYTMCPLFEGTTFVGWDNFEDKTNTFHWENLCTPEELADYQQKLETACSAYYAQLYEDDCDLVKYLSIYRSFTMACVYNYDLQAEYDACEKNEDQSYVGSTLRTLTEHIGQCSQLASCYTFLCTQAGLNAVTVGCNEKAHEWAIIELDGKYYYVDPTWDLPGDDGLLNLSRFGMTAEDRYLDGGYTLEETSFSVNYPLFTLESLGLDDARFDDVHSWKCEHITDFVIDHEAGTVTVTNDAGETTVIK